ncbi:DUF2058 domain-containing protein [Thalassotalea aquiviva]|uniref:DUF2058 domain-containing protein n=1 Tax=Thalassotalea aquiviva TaxID=3242415 RepID=UPI00352A211B
MSSLQEQLLKAGLTTKQKARQANTDKRRKNKQKRSGANVEVSLQEQIKQDLEAAQAEKAAKDKALNEEKKMQLAAKELQNRISQILQHHHVKNYEGELAYNYTDENKVKKLFVNNQTQQALVNGRLAVCGLMGTTYIVTSQTAEKIATLDPSVILLHNDNVTGDEVDEDDPYAEYQIPDDLMW